MKKKLVQYEIDLAHPPALTEAQKAEIALLKAAPESAIDYSEIPPLDDAFWKTRYAIPTTGPPRLPQPCGIDSDVLLWLRAQGRGYQSRINALLRREMLGALQAERARTHLKPECRAKRSWSTILIAPHRDPFCSFRSRS